MQGERVIPQYLVCNYLPDDLAPTTVTGAMIEEIHVLNRELIASGDRKFACGISPANVNTVRKQPDGSVLVTDGWYIETKQHRAVFGYWKPPIWTRHSRGRARVPSPAMRWARRELLLARPRTMNRPTIKRAEKGQ